MIDIEEIKKEQGIEVQGVLKIWLYMQNENDSSILVLVDATGNIIQAKVDDCIPDYSADLIQLKGHMAQESDGTWIIHIINYHMITHVDTQTNPDVDFLADERKTLAGIIERIQLPALKAFVCETFSDEKLFRIFTKIPVSRKHHHHEEGGLFKHSIECCEIVLNLLPQPSLKRDLSLVGALFHDIGHVWHALGYGNSKMSSYLLQHDSLTLQVLNNSLLRLRREWPDGEIALSYIWTWQQQPRKPRYPLLNEALIVQMADRLSRQTDCHRIAFEGLEEWKQFGKVDGGGPVTHCWRPKLPEY